MRQSGVLLHVTSLPGPEGIGTLGQPAYDFIDFLRRGGFSVWQMLPIGPTGFGDSPYQSPSAFAGNPLLIDMRQLQADGLLPPSAALCENAGARVDFKRVRNEKEALLKQSFDANGARVSDKVNAFARENPWTEVYARYETLCELYGPFSAWPREAKRYCLEKDEKTDQALRDNAARVAYHLYVQYLFAIQWARLKKYAAAHGIALFGDMPIYAAPGSADVWANPKIFQMDEDVNSTRVAGVPPDYFSADGQLWGNPLYNWRALSRDHYRWWIARLKVMGERFDILRIDHFIGFANYYSIPAGAKNARTGKWIKNRGRRFFKAVEKALPGLTIVAEDLGAVNKRVRRLIDFCGYPGMKVLEFAFDGGEENPHLPQNTDAHCVVYTGTHDNDTAAGWWAESDEKRRARVREVLNMAPDDEIAPALVRAALSSKAERAVIPLQDLLGLDGSARMNTPGTVGGNNWRYRALSGQLTDALADELRALNEQYDRGVKG